VSLKRLDPFSREFSNVLFREWPEWEVLAIGEPNEEGPASHLVVRVPDPPGSNLDTSLTILTDKQEVTVGMDLYHAHFDRPDDGTLMAAAVEFIRSLLSEDMAALSYFGGGRWMGSCRIVRADCIVSKFKTKPTEAWWQEVDRFRVRSWRGTLDAEGTY